ncbi:MAG: helix-turn-helix transcriptional regulator [Sphaerochaetaceae bacterium]|jgi:transcriptional regulator with XRE-family HTH domain|nr:helix-turn-helix transcriptional regulator [Sphaerochaetaceae bacterium]NLY06963.1 XRE family transcriptional regulator [Spirochaetales bacterium]
MKTSITDGLMENELSEQEKLRRTVSRELNEAMVARKVSKADLARALETSRSNITQILKGDRNFTVDTLSRIAEAIGMTVTISFKKNTGARRQ